MEDEDFLLALRLQEQFDQETSAVGWSDEDCPSSKRRKIDSSGLMDVIPYSQARPERPLSIVDESWETLDPNPDIRAMFLQFNDKFFWGKLSGVEVKWSPRMTLCAGVCSYEGRGGLCSIRLSEPLLKLRPRKDLVQTLLHEMIHALLFVTQNNRDRDGHGPEFCKHMDRINQASGTHITIYHSFHDEVDVYRQHWWRCNGPCQNRRPFFGYVKRAMNRPPSPRDPWWAEHQRTCGGTYTKIKEPENYGKTGKTDKKKDNNPSNETSKDSRPPRSTTGSGSQDIRNIIPFSGRGFILGGNMQTSTNKQSQSPPKAQPEPLVSPPDSPLLPRLRPFETNLFKRVGSGASNVPRKKSVGNTNAFINVNGSPVRISKGNDLRGKQRSVRDLFQAIVLKSPERAASASSSSKPDTEATAANPAKCNGPSSSSAKTSLINNHHSSTTTGPKPGSTESNLSKYFGSSAKTEFPDSKSKAFGSPQKSAASTPGYVSKFFGSNQKLGSDAASSGFRNTGSPQSSHTSTTSGSKHFGGSGKPESNFPSPRSIGSPRTSGTTPSGAKKRSWEDHNSEHIFDYFQRTVGESATSAVQQREKVGDTVWPAVWDQQANNPPVQITVHCPVCHIKVPESTINQHLDSCLS
ncbi:DNA-dependent metalloprotease SPRTN [Ctenopharyngodon idella]|uniref:DNA-dependent metalloprotease SPRTN n=1 Tax=Ctenopharyngodon idella TaxID=7959 RepID=UPI00222EC7D2|nr:DNA-dependent metalloprotease SPRTN [Ctenopharyngodon idella]